MSDFIINPQEMGRRIRDLREKKHKTQSYYADLFYISPSYLALIEAGKRVPNLEVLIQIARVCEVSLDYLVYGEETLDEENQGTFSRLCSRYSVDDISRGLRLMEYYLILTSQR